MFFCSYVKKTAVLMSKKLRVTLKEIKIIKINFILLFFCLKNFFSFV